MEVADDCLERSWAVRSEFVDFEKESARARERSGNSLGRQRLLDVALYRPHDW